MLKQQRSRGRFWRKCLGENIILTLGKGAKKIKMLTFSKLVLTPPPQNVNFLKNFSKFGVPKILLLLSELTKTHSCVKEIHFEACFHSV